MSLTKKSVQRLYFKAAQESLKNARLWLEDANHLLYDKQSYGHSLSLIIFSIEETMKSWVCFSVGVGNQDPSDEMVKEVFSSHPSKLETAIMWYFIVNVPLFQATLWKELSDTESDALKSLFLSLESKYDTAISHLVNLRMKGIYVDIIDAKLLSTPKEISKPEAEGFYYDAFRFIQYLEQAIKTYEEADPQEKERRKALMRTSTKLMQENLAKIASLENIEEDNRG